MIRLSITSLFLCGCGWNSAEAPPVLRAVTPDKIGLSIKFDEDDEYSGYNVGTSWDIE